jgi:hypothetical protein
LNGRHAILNFTNGWRAQLLLQHRAEKLPERTVILNYQDSDWRHPEFHTQAAKVEVVMLVVS